MVIRHGASFRRRFLAVALFCFLFGVPAAYFPAAARASGTPTPKPVATRTPTPSPTVSATPTPTPGKTQPLLDWSVPNGHFYTEANGYPLGTSPMGYAIVDDAQAQFWTGFQHLGGVDRLGYPVSQRFLWEGFLTQATQKAVLQWRPESRSVVFVNVFDDLSEVGKDEWLQTVQAVPTPLPGSFDAGKKWSDVMANRMALLKTRPALDRAYHAVDDPLDLYGLPTSPVVDVGPMYIIRLQRAVLQEWKIKEPWANPGQVTVANGGDVAKQSGVFPWKLMRPVAPTDSGWTDHLDQYTLDGKGTWYGPGFAGKVMANGQTYDPNDPTTTAANAFPVGSQLKVTSKRTGESIEVYVRDTGDFAYPRLVDLSPAAFARLGVSPAVGIQDVTVSLVVPPTSVSSSTQAPPSR